VVVVIIGILIAIAIPLYLNYEKGAKDKSAASDVRGAISALEQCNTDNGALPGAATINGTSTAYTLGAGTGGTACTGILNISSGTTLTYTFTAGPPQSYKVVGTNSGGSGASYCYNSAAGGAVTKATTC
jgi:type IV pilus assembly protein PilA